MTSLLCENKFRYFSFYCFEYFIPTFKKKCNSTYYGCEICKRFTFILHKLLLAEYNNKNSTQNYVRRTSYVYEIILHITFVTETRAYFFVVLWKNAFFTVENHLLQFVIYRLHIWCVCTWNADNLGIFY